MSSLNDLENEKRFQELTEVLMAYSLGDFDVKASLSPNLDVVDTFISGVNMLGEELKSTTISRDFFNRIFNTVSDMLFVLDATGIIKTANQTVFQTLGYAEHELMGKTINKLVPGKKQFISKIKEQVVRESGLDFPAEIKTAENSVIPVSCSVSYLVSESPDKKEYLLIVRDLSKLKEYETDLQRSERKYRTIFEKSKDSIFLMDREGKILQINNAGEKLLRVHVGDNFYDTLVSNKEKLHKRLLKYKSILNEEVKIKGKQNIFEGVLNTTKVQLDGVEDNYQAIIRDITWQKETEKKLLKTVVDTQENERQRFAKDLHDSLGQQISAIKFYIGTLTANESLTPKVQQVLNKSIYSLDLVMTELRNICFNLMPQTLEKFGLITAVSELCQKVQVENYPQFVFKGEETYTVKDKGLEIALFRIIQEFINNALKHGKASKIFIFYEQTEEKLLVRLQDNGLGFDLKKGNDSLGMGLKNIHSRAKSYNGVVKVESKPDFGTSYEISIPLKK